MTKLLEQGVQKKDKIKSNQCYSIVQCKSLIQGKIQPASIVHAFVSCEPGRKQKSVLNMK